MRYLRSIFLTLLTLSAFSPSVFGSETITHRAGRIATLIDEVCGRYDLSQKLYNKFGDQSDYNEGELSVSPYKDDTSIDCGSLERSISWMLERQGWFSSNYSERQVRVCQIALDPNTERWSTSKSSPRYVAQAREIGLTEEACAHLLLSARSKSYDTKVAALLEKSKTTRSYANIYRAQRALQELGFYSGRLDGINDEKTKKAFGKWLKNQGLPKLDKIPINVLFQLESLAKNHKESLASPRIKSNRTIFSSDLKKNQRSASEEAQVVKLESDALEAIAKREEERKEKAKRLAEANRIKNPDAIAVIIGNRDYEGSTPDVDFAGNDADAMKAYVLNTLGYRPGNVIDLRDASKAKLEDAFGTKENHKGRLYDYVRADESDVIVFYSGHGVPGMSDKRGYLLAVDANPNRAELTGYPVDVLLKNLAKVPAKSMMVFIDACFSGDSPKGMLVRATSGLTVKITAPKKASDNMIVITAAEGDQFASWDEDAKHGLFTKHLLEALNGEADKHAKTGNKDGKVTLGEVKAYLDREMTYQARRRFSRDQHASVSGDLKTVLSAY